MTTTPENTDAPPTAAGSSATDETVVVPPPAETASELAWSLEDDDATERIERHPWGLAWGHAAAVLSIAAVVAFVIAVVGWTIMRSGRDPRPLPSKAHPTQAAAQLSTATPVVVPPTSTVTVQASPTTVTVQAPPPAPKTTTIRVTAEPTSETPSKAVGVPRLSDSVYDQQFLDRMRSLGYIVIDPPLMLTNAHEACRLFQLGESAAQVNEQMSARMGASMTDTLQLTSSAILAYPNCFRRNYSDGD